MAEKDEKEKKGKEGEGAKFELTDEAKDFIGQAVNGAVASHLKRPSFREALGGVVKDALEPVVADIKKLIPANDGKNGGSRPTGGEDDEGGDEKELAPKWKAQLVEQQRQIDTLNKTLAAQRDAVEAEKRANRETRERNAVLEYLRKGGVLDDVAGAAAIMLQHEKRVKTDTKGNVLFVTRRDVSGETVEEDWPAEKGVAEWLKKEGKAFLPPQDGSGSGGGGARNRNQGNRDRAPTKSEQEQNLFASLISGQ